jgi:hypothetical protein
MNTDDINLLELIKACGAPLVMFIAGLFFPQVKIRQILEAFTLGHSHDGK